MAISHGPPLLLPLLISLFFLPAALGISIRFEKCNRTHDYPIHVFNVDLSRHPINRSTNANITIIAGTNIDISDGATVVVNATNTYLINPGRSIKSYSLCDIVECPVTPSFMELALSNAFIVKELKGILTPVTVSITVEKKSMMCVKFVCVVVGRSPT